MSIIGITSIFLGTVIILSRGMLMIAPGITLNGFRAIIQTSTRTRVFGLCILPLGALMIWAGYSDHSTLAEILMFFGWWVIGGGLILLVIFPSVYIAMLEAMLPSETSTDFFGWRLLGLFGVAIGALFVYFGMLAL